MPTFAALGLPEPLVTALTAHGFTTPFPIQAATLPMRSPAATCSAAVRPAPARRSRSGSPSWPGCRRSARPRRPRGLVLVPTRELATQVVEAISFAKALADHDLRVGDVLPPPGG
jgi:superfamily II DNA/RNA helicase